ncbi:hypothetical protein M5D96_002413 [Drosophila gunungcola]|uniref:Uncharacterized protein n=1 Tax=Drosophila gunungcola TaxID=103775 RepID=A0A9P9YZZ0_9MUSC|nr:hypothetical protein M5D96_002413 [Drosophila gunungcola]
MMRAAARRRTCRRYRTISSAPRCGSISSWVNPFLVVPALTIQFCRRCPTPTSTATSRSIPDSLPTWRPGARVGTTATSMDARPRSSVQMAPSSHRRSSSATGGSMCAAISHPGCTPLTHDSTSAPR